MFRCAHFLCPWVFQIYFEHNLSCALYTQNIIWEGSSYFPFLGGCVTTLYAEQNMCGGFFNLREPARRCSQLPVHLTYSTVMQVNAGFWPFSNMNSMPCGYNLLSDITTRLHCSVRASLTPRAAGEWKKSESTVVTNLSLHQTNRRALDLQNNQQPAKRFEQTPAGCHSEEQMPFLKK